MEGLCVMGLGDGVSQSWVNWLISLFGVVALDEGVLGWLVVVFLFKSMRSKFVNSSYMLKSGVELHSIQIVSASSRVLCIEFSLMVFFCEVSEGDYREGMQSVVPW